MIGFIITDATGKSSSCVLYPTEQDARDSLAAIRAEWPGHFDDHKVITARITTEPTPEELIAAKQAIHRPQMPAGEYVARRAAIEDIAADAIRAYAKVFAATRAIALLRIAVGQDDSPETDLLRAVLEILDMSDPEDAPGNFDAAHRALDAVQEAHWSGERMVAE